MDQLSLDVRLPDQADFANYVRGANDAAVDALVLHSTERHDPVLWLWGAPATGKSHLLVAACRQCDDAGGTAAFLSGSEIERLSPGDLQAWDGYDLVAVDDVDALAGNASWENALFELFNALRDAGGVMLVSAGAPPRDIGFGLADLASRLSQGPVYRLVSLSDDERLAALRVRASDRGFELPDETGRYLLYRYPRDLSSLFAVLDRLDDASLRAQRRITVPFVKQVLERSS